MYKILGSKSFGKLSIQSESCKLYVHTITKFSVVEIANSVRSDLYPDNQSKLDLNLVPIFRGYQQHSDYIFHCADNFLYATSFPHLDNCSTYLLSIHIHSVGESRKLIPIQGRPILETMSRTTSGRPSSLNSSYGIYRNKDRKGRQEVEHDIFLRCAEISDDKEWKRLFTEMAKGRFPEHFRYDGSTMYYTRLRKGQSAKLMQQGLVIGNEAEEECQRVRPFIYRNSGFLTAEQSSKLREMYKEERHTNNLLLSKAPGTLFQLLHGVLLKEKEKLELSKQRLFDTRLTNYIYRIIDLIDAGELGLDRILISDDQILSILGVEVTSESLEVSGIRGKAAPPTVDLFAVGY